MKGKLLQTKTGWIIRYEDLFRLYPFSQSGMKEIHIHPEYQKYYFLDADADGSDVEFEIVTGDNGIRLAKLIRPNEQAQELEMGHEGYIGDETDTDKIERILDRAMNEDRLLAQSHWEGCDGCDENDKYFWITGFMMGLNVGRGDLKEYFKQFKQPKKD
jgi:hypothetical protein